MRKMSMPVSAASCDEGVGDLGRVRRVAHGVAPAQQHLQADVRHCLAQLGQPVPGVLGEEPQRDVVRRPTPRLDVSSCGVIRETWPGDGEQVTGAHAGREQRLVGVAERRVGDRDPLLPAQAGGEPLRSELQQRLSRPSGAGTSRSMSGSLLTGSTLAGASPCGLLTVTSASYVSSLVPRSAFGRAREQTGVFLDERRVERPARKSGSSSSASGKGCWWRRHGSGTRRPPGAPSGRRPRRCGRGR